MAGSATDWACPTRSAAEEVAVLAYDYPLLGVFWSLLLLFLFVMVGFVVSYTFIDNFRRADHTGLAKAGWALFIIVLPLFGAVIYILARPEMRDPPSQLAV
jgi:hypothetical protein